METKNKTWFSSHSHAWIVIIAASILAIIFINRLPNEKIFSSILIGLIASHTLIITITIFGGWLLIPEKILKKFCKQDHANEYDFGWSSKWMNGFGYASFIFFSWLFIHFMHWQATRLTRE